MKLNELEVYLDSLCRVHKEGLIEMILSLDGQMDEPPDIPAPPDDTDRPPAPPDNPGEPSQPARCPN